jgi:hypothetical protein
MGAWGVEEEVEVEVEGLGVGGVEAGREVDEEELVRGLVIGRPWGGRGGGAEGGGVDGGGESSRTEGAGGGRQ